MLGLRLLLVFPMLLAPTLSTFNYGSLPTCAVGLLSALPNSADERWQKNAALDHAQNQGLDCGYDIACYCSNTTFLASLNGVFQQQCTQSEAQGKDSQLSKAIAPQ